MTLTRRLLLSYAAIVLTTSVVLTVAADRGLRSRLETELIGQLEREARYLDFATRGFDRVRLDSLVHALGATTQRRLMILARNGELIADSDFPLHRLAPLENYVTHPEVAAALAGRLGVDRRRSASTGAFELNVAIPGTANTIVRVSAPIDHVDSVVRNAQGAVLGGAVIAMAVAMLLALGFSFKVSRPLRRLSAAAQAIAHGEHPTLDLRGRDEVGQLARALHSLDQDLTARLEELEHEQSGTDALIASMVEGVVACDPIGQVTTINPAARSLLGLDPGASVPPIQELFRRRAAAEAVRDVLRGETVIGLEIEIEGRVVLLSGRRLQRGGAILVLHDVTALKRLETMRRDLVANVSHELKTPLTVLRGYAETLLDPDVPAELRSRFIAAILDHSQRMQRLIDDLLDLSRIEAGAWQPEPREVRIEDLARDAWSAITTGRSDSPAFATEIASDAGVVHADPEMLRQALTNLFDNAIRHTPQSGAVTVRTARSAEGVVITVSDTGQGIPHEHLPRIFERFYRVDTGRDRSRGGTGLGLAIVKHIVERHGGRVEASSSIGKGTTMTLVFPAGPRSSNQE